MKLRKSFIFPLLALLGSCSNQDPLEPVQGIAITDPFAMLKRLTASEDPFLLFGQAYPAFTFTTKATLTQTNANGEMYNQFHASTLFEQIEGTYFHIQRVPFAPIPSVELIFDHGLFYLRPDQQTAYYQIKKNPEITRLKKTVLKELLHYFDLQELTRVTPVTRDNMACYDQAAQSICFDPQTQLPIHGSATQELPLASHIQLDFHLAVGSQDIDIVTPTEVHSLRTHE